MGIMAFSEVALVMLAFLAEVGKIKWLSQPVVEMAIMVGLLVTTVMVNRLLFSLESVLPLLLPFLSPSCKAECFIQSLKLFTWKYLNRYKVSR